MERHDWIPKIRTKEREWRIFADLVKDMEETGAGKAWQGGLGADEMRRIARGMSIACRKLVVERWLNRVARNTVLKPLRKVKENWMQVSIYTDPNRGEESRIGTGKWGSMPGYELIGGQEVVWKLHSEIFNREAEGTKTIGRGWEDQKMISGVINGEEAELSILDIIKFVANTEGAHDDPKRSRYSRLQRKIPEMLGGCGDEEEGEDSEIQVGVSEQGEEHVTYPQWATIGIGIYLYNEIKDQFRRNEDVWSERMGKHFPGGVGHIVVEGLQRGMRARGPMVIGGGKIGTKAGHIQVGAARELYTPNLRWVRVEEQQGEGQERTAPGADKGPNPDIA